MPLLPCLSENGTPRAAFCRRDFLSEQPKAAFAAFFFFVEKSKNLLQSMHACVIIKKKIVYKLIKSGGGTGPVKPGNLSCDKVLNPDR